MVLKRGGQGPNSTKSSLWWIKSGLLWFVGVFLCFQLFVLWPFQLAVLSSSQMEGGGLPIAPNQRNDEATTNRDKLLDIVTLVHHDDLSVFVDYGLASWKQYFCQPNTRIFVVCTPEAQTKMERLQAADKHNIWSNVILVSQVVYPFNLELVGIHNWGNKFTWIYQQLLKVYAYEVLSTHTPALKQRFVVLDSDAVAIRPYEFISRADGKALYNIASISSGAFENDCILQARLLHEVFPDNSVPAAFPEHQGEKFSTITHHMMMDGKILTDMLSAISKLHNKPAWQVLSSLKDSVLSEWELHMAWIMKYHRDSFYLVQTPFLNSGRIDATYLEWLKQARDVYYLTKHDDYSADNMCCVNSQWPTIVEPNVSSCDCCTQKGCRPPTITCKMLGVPGCQQDSDGLLYFEESSSFPLSQ